MRKCHRTTSDLGGRCGDMEAKTVIRGSRCRFPYDHASSVNCCWYFLFSFFSSGSGVYKAMSQLSPVFRDRPT